MLSSMISSAPCPTTDIAFFSPSKVAKSGASSTSNVTVKTRLARRPVTPHRSSSTASFLPSSSPPSLCSSPLSSSPIHKIRKRKSLPEELSTASTPSADLPRAVKRLRAGPKDKAPKRKTGTSSRTSSRASSRRPSSPEPIYRSDRSRSTSLFHSNDPERASINRRWATDEVGTPGSKETLLSSEAVVKKLMKSYKAYFTNPDDPTDKSFEPHPTNYPVIELEYPNSGASERFILLAPKDVDHYNPIMDLEKTLYTIVECCLQEKHLGYFGPIPNATLSDATSPPPSPSPPCSIGSNTSSLTASTSSSRGSPSPLDRLPVLRAVQRAIHLQDGPLFLKAMDRVNKLLHSIKYPATEDPFAPNPSNGMMVQIESWTNKPLQEKVLMRIIEENYQRTVGPNVPSLKRYEAFTSTVYGELMPSLVKEIIELTGLKEDNLFLDLGSGVGNIVVQASLQTGCRSYGIELMPHPARVARDMVEQIQIRCKMWGIKVGNMELEEGDMMKSESVTALMAIADVVLVDNKVFEESLNEALRPKFLDLKEGAYVISLKPFVNAVNARVTKRNVDDMSAIFHVEEKFYHPGSVSWGNSGGSYYLHRVDRAGYANVKERFDNLHGTSTRSSRSRK